ncbi:DeoR family transcriptional regulator [Lelliottia wanjuensis]
MISIIIELYQTGENHVGSLESKFNISRETVHRDLRQLEPMITRTSKGTYGLSKPVIEILNTFNA